MALAVATTHGGDGAMSVDAIPEGEGWQGEPEWDGFEAGIVARAGAAGGGLTRAPRVF